MASGYKWGDLEDTRAALLVRSSKSRMKAAHAALSEGLPRHFVILQSDQSEMKGRLSANERLLIHLKSHLALNNTRIVFTDILSISFANNPDFTIITFLIKSHRLN